MSILTAARLRVFHARTTPEPNTGCHLWLATVDKDGYGVFSVNHQSKRAHRVAWELANGAIPTGLCVLHRCDTPCCVNPDHLWLGTTADNTADREKKRRGRMWPSSCPQGHEFTVANTGHGGAWRRCKKCVAAYHHRRWALRVSVTTTTVPA